MSNLSKILPLVKQEEREYRRLSHSVELPCITLLTIPLSLSLLQPLLVLKYMVISFIVATLSCMRGSNWVKTEELMGQGCPGHSTLFPQEQMLLCYFTRLQSELWEHTSLIMTSWGPGVFRGCVFLVLSKWVGELAEAFLTHWDNYRAEGDKNRFLQHMGPFLPSHLLIHLTHTVRRWKVVKGLSQCWDFFGPK